MNATCPTCGGKGWIGELAWCHTCKGVGTVPAGDDYERGYNDGFLAAVRQAAEALHDSADNREVVLN
jgi:DnaJ-class molecular chaperone